MKDSFLRNTAWIAITNLLIMLLAVVTGPLTARLLRPEGRGELAAIQSWSQFLMVIGVLGFTDSLVYYGSKRQKQLELAFTTWSILLPASILFMIIGYFAMPYLLAAQRAEVVAEARRYLFLIPFAGLNSIHYLHMSWNRLVIWNLLRLVLPGLYAFVLAFAWLFVGHVSPEWVARAYFVIYIVYSLTVVATLRVYGPARPRVASDLRLPMFRFGLQSVLGSLPQLLNLRLDQLVMTAFVQPTQLGWYVVAVSWSTILSGAVSAIGQAIFPELAQLTDPDSSRERLAQLIRIGFWVDVTVTVVMLVLTPIGLPLLFTRGFLPAVPSAFVLVLASGVLYFKMLLANGLKGIGQPAPVAWAEGIGLVVTLALLAWLLPAYGIIGAATASLAAYSLSCIVLTCVVSRSSGLPVGSFFRLNYQDWAGIRTQIRKKLKRGPHMSSASN